MWYLFPFNAANRLMKKNGEIDNSWQIKLNSLFGDNSWEAEFYQKDQKLNLFNPDPTIRTADTISIKEYVEKRLKTVFPAVSNYSRILCNSNNSPLFLFCFAVSNTNYAAQGLALKVADYILKDKKPN